jgi:hypothetical protein
VAMQDRARGLHVSEIAERSTLNGALSR